MNYTDWLQGRFSSLSHASSAEIYGYIKQAKSETKLLRSFVSIAILLVILLSSNMLLSSMGFEPFKSIIYWCTFTVLASISTKQAEQKIIKNKLTKIVQSKYT